MEFCTNCGAEMPNGIVFCTNCGARKSEPYGQAVVEEPSAPFVETPQEVPQPMPQAIPQDVPQPMPQAASRETQQKTVYTTNGWILGLKILAWITFGVCVLTGLITGAIAGLKTGDEVVGALIYGNLGLLAGAFVGFMSVAFMMVFLGIAQDLKRIRKDLNEMNK